MASKGAPPGNYVTQVQFIVEKDGTLSNISMVKHLGYDLDKNNSGNDEEFTKMEPC